MKDRYHSFLLRIWEAGTPENPVWRVSIENTATREMVGFNSLGEMVEYIRNAVDENNGTDTLSFGGYSRDPMD